MLSYFIYYLFFSIPVSHVSLLCFFNFIANISTFSFILRSLALSLLLLLWLLCCGLLCAFCTMYVYCRKEFVSCLVWNIIYMMLNFNSIRTHGFIFHVAVINQMNCCNNNHNANNNNNNNNERQKRHRKSYTM